MAFQYQVEHWSTGQVAFKMPDRDLTSQDLAILSLPWYVLAAQVQTSPWVFDRLNKKKAFKGIYAPGLALESLVSVSPPFNYNKKAKGIEILHKYMVELEGLQVKLKIDLSDYTDEKSREEALDFITTYAYALKMGLASSAPHLAVSIQAVGPQALAQITEYQKVKKAEMEPKITEIVMGIKITEIVMGIFYIPLILSMIFFFTLPVLVVVPALIPFIIPSIVVASVTLIVSFAGVSIVDLFSKNKEKQSREQKEYQQICMNISPLTELVSEIHASTLEPSVFSNSSAVESSVVDPNVSAAAPGEMAPGAGEAAPGAGELVNVPKKFK